ncbi:MULTISPECIES: hypothetical protein [Neptunomonas]|uniref:Uncharacterized protein n=1 Tax=Neptunomonas marina TaxID=1815562 RepID=A0A437QDX4_9GAMM|nr:MULTISPECIES: hypothetical protein [Neptunomonas]RVU32721.1 hypothetical protein EOE65_03435 [Neptunomonas marina]
MRHALINGGVVVSVQRCPPDYLAHAQELYEAVVPLGSSLAGPNWTYDSVSGEFAPPPEDMSALSVPETVTRFQAKALLHLSGHLPAVEAYMESQDTPFLTKLAWQEASFHRNSTMIIEIGSQLGLTPQEIDEMFIQASAIS